MSYERNIDITQGYHFKEDKQTHIGFITKLKIGDIDFAADQTCKNPMNPVEKLNIVAVLGGVLWGTGITDAIYLSGQISPENKLVIAPRIYMGIKNVQTVFQFKVYEYDTIAKKYFLSFHCNGTDMNGLIEKRGDDLNLSVADEPSMEVQEPENYAFQICIKPQPSAQTLRIATAEQKIVVKSWGLTVG